MIRALLLGLILSGPVGLTAAHAAEGSAAWTPNDISVSQTEAANNLGRYENILRRLDEITFGITQETEPLARDLYDSFAELGLACRVTFSSGLA